MSEFKVNQLKRRRGAVLGFIYTGHTELLSRMDNMMLWGLMQELGFGVGQDEVLTLLQDLRERGYLKFEEKKNRLSGRTEISKIAITPAGRDVVERIKDDAGVLLP